MGRHITRRDFLNGLSIGVAGTAMISPKHTLAKAVKSASVTSSDVYPPTLKPSRDNFMQKNELQYLSDYVAIRQLNAKYNRYADLADGTSYANLFTEDAEFNIVGEGIYVGREQIAARCNATTTTVHITTEPELDISGDTAQQRVRMLTAFQDGKGTRNEFVASGWYIDELKRTEEGWRYHRRRVELDLDINALVEKKSEIMGTSTNNYFLRN